MRADHSPAAAVVAIVVALVFVALCVGVPRLRSRRALAAVVVAVFTFGVAAAVAFSAASMRARLQLWGAAWSIFLDHPWTGVGIHNFILAYQQYLPTQAPLIAASTAAESVRGT